MVNFKYTAKDLQGRDVAATMTAESEGEVIGKLRKSGLIPVKIVRDEKAGRKRFQKKVKAEAV
ncbi:MAG TPA: hypothetical protein PLI86_09875, partial [bacterium]|nr:hypothetical protein [bacterium]